MLAVDNLNYSMFGKVQNTHYCGGIGVYFVLLHMGTNMTKKRALTQECWMGWVIFQCSEENRGNKSYHCCCKPLCNHIHCFTWLATMEVFCFSMLLIIL